MTEELDELKASGSNSEMDEGGYDGDMMLDDDQWEMVRASVEDGSQVDKRKAIADLTKRWPNAEIPYYVNTDVGKLLYNWTTLCRHITSLLMNLKFIYLKTNMTADTIFI